MPKKTTISIISKIIIKKKIEERNRKSKKILTGTQRETFKKFVRDFIPFVIFLFIEFFLSLLNFRYIIRCF